MPLYMNSCLDLSITIITILIITHTTAYILSINIQKIRSLFVSKVSHATII